MKEFYQVNIPPEGAEDLGSVTLTFAQRERSRLHVELDIGEEAGLFLARGTVLKEGDVLSNEAGYKVTVKAAKEKVSTIKAKDMHLLLRIAYHLGNRHVPLQVEPTWLRYVHDHVLDDMVRQLGGEVIAENAPFNPETGAYSGGHHHKHDNRLAPILNMNHSHGHHH